MFGFLKIMLPLLLKGIDVEKLHSDVCKLAKHHSFPVSNRRVSIPFALVHSDICGPSTVPYILGSRWFASFIDDCARVSWIFLLKQKLDVSTIFPNFHKMVKTQFGVGSLGLITQMITLIKSYLLIFKMKVLRMNPLVLVFHN